MSEIQTGAYFTDLAAAYCRGALGLPTGTNAGEAIEAGVAAKLPYIYRFKRHDVPIPRVKELLGIIRSFGVTNILDVASQRGAFLWPLLNSLSEDGLNAEVTSIDIDEDVIAFLSTVANGRRESDIVRFTAVRADITDMQNSTGRTGFASFADDAFDCVICSEILEHLSDPSAAVRETLRVSSDLVVCTVPAQPDNNKEHIQLFYDGRPHESKKITRRIQQRQIDLRRLWLDAGARSVKVRVVHDGPISVLLAVIKK